MKKTIFFIFFVSIACSTSNPSPTLDSNLVQTAIIGTAQEAQNQTQAASSSTAATVILLLTETPAAPISLVYEGMTISCICENCICVSNIVITARITIDNQGYITGSLDQYLADAPPLSFEGTKNDLHGFGLMNVEFHKGEFKFVGKLYENLSTLEATISWTGKYANGTSDTGKRELLLFRKN